MGSDGSDEFVPSLAMTYRVVQTGMVTLLDISNEVDDVARLIASPSVTEYQVAPGTGFHDNVPELMPMIVGIVGLSDGIFTDKFVNVFHALSFHDSLMLSETVFGAV